MSFEATNSIAAPLTANARAGPACSTGTRTCPRPPALAAADPVKTNGRCGWALCQAGTAVCDSRTAV